MCIHCREDMSRFVYTDETRFLHDASMFPHGRGGYSGVTWEMVEAAKARCPFCLPSGVM